MMVSISLWLGGCSLDDSDDPPSEWTWTELGGPEAEVSPFAGNHEPLVVTDTHVLLGTADGVWRRHLGGEDTWQQVGLGGLAIHALVRTHDADRIVAAGFDPDDERAPTVWYSTDGGTSWTSAGTWPQGGRPEIPVRYCDEVWTGIEYQVAAHLIYAGLVDEGLTVVRGLRDRHDGERRNPWNEFECGNHYARAMASWAAVLALTGFRYSAVTKELVLANKPGPLFWSTGYAWGTGTIENAGRQGTRLSLTVVEGQIALRTIALGSARAALDADRMLAAGQTATFEAR